MLLLFVCYLEKCPLPNGCLRYTGVFCSFSMCYMANRGHSDALVTHSPPTSKVGGSNPGQLVVDNF